MCITLLFDFKNFNLTTLDYNIITSITKDKIVFQVFSDSVNLTDGVTKGEKNLLVVTDSDDRISYWTRKQLPVIAFSHDGNREESLMGAAHMILSLEALTYDYIMEVHHHFYKIPIRILETDRCYLRELSMDDHAKLIKLDQEQSASSAGRFFKEDGDTVHFLSEYIGHQYAFYGYGIYGAFHKENDEFLGIAGFSPCDDCCEIGYAVKKSARHKGYAKEWIRALMIYARDTLCLDEIIARISKDNVASINTARSCQLTMKLYG